MIVNLLILIVVCGTPWVSTLASSPSQVVDSAQIAMANEAIFAPANRYFFRISPKGKQISWLEKQPQSTQVKIAPANCVTCHEKHLAVPLPAKATPIMYFWTADENRLLILYFSPEASRPVLGRFDIATRSLVPLFPEPQAQIVFTDSNPLVGNGEPVTVFSIAADGKDHYYRVNYATGERVLLPEHEGGWVFDARADSRLLLRRSGKNLQWWFKPTASTAPIALLGEDDRAFAKHSSLLGTYQAETGWHAVIADYSHGDTLTLMEINLTSGARTPLFSEPADWKAVWIDPTGRPAAVQSHYLQPRWQPLQQSVSQDIAYLETQGLARANLVSGTRDGTMWLLADKDGAGFETIWLFQRKLRSLTRIAPAMATPGRFVWQVRPLLITARDGLPLVAYLSTPNNQ